MLIERHVFGSISGYGTLARSPGLNDAECRKLADLAFGTPYDASYQSSLARDVAYLSRPLSPVKRAVTRVLAGKPDDAGRPTLLFLTSVLSTDDWNFVCQGDALSLLRCPDLWRWNGSPRLSPVDVPDVATDGWKFSAASAGRILGLLSLVELSWTSRRPVVVRADQYSLAETAAVERLLPADVRRRYSAVYRGLNPDLPVTISCLADGVSAAAGASPQFLNQPKTPYALQLAGEGFGDGRMPDSLLVGFDKFGEPNIDSKDHPAEGQTVNTHEGRGRGGTIRRGAAPISAPLLALTVLLIFLIGAAAGWLAASPRTAAPAKAPQYLDLVSTAVAITTAPRARQLETLEDLGRRIQSIDDADPRTLETLSQTLNDARERVRLLQRTEELIVAVSRDDGRAVIRAEDALNKLERKLPDSGVYLRDWLAAKQRPETDALESTLNNIEPVIKKDVKEAERLKRSIDVKLAQKARAVVYALELLESACPNDRPRWIADSLSDTNEVIEKYESNLEQIDQKNLSNQAEKDSLQNASLELLTIRLNALGSALQSTPVEPSTRTAVAEALLNVGADGAERMGTIFSEKMEMLANWILALQSIETPALFKTVQDDAANCATLAGELLNSFDDVNWNNMRDDNMDTVRNIKDQAHVLNKALKDLEESTNKLTAPEESTDAESPD